MKEEFGIRIGTVYGLEGEIVQSANNLAASFDTELGIKRKVGLAGPNDIIYLIAHIDFWRDALPFVLKSISAGALGAVGAALYNRSFKTQMQNSIDRIDARQSMIIDRIDELNKTISSIDRYREGGEVRYAIPTPNGICRGDVGFNIVDMNNDPAIAIMAINLVADDANNIIDDLKRRVDEGSLYEYQISGEITLNENGEVICIIRAGDDEFIIKK